MDLYDIHTHYRGFADNSDGFSIVTILNTYPQTFSDIKANCGSTQLFSCGIHPWYVDDFQTDYSILESIVNDDRVVAIGEVGLDKLKGGDLDKQMVAFGKQIELSERVGKPMIIHCVKAWDELIALHMRHKPHQRWIIHGFRGKAQLAVQLLDRGMKISIGERFNEDTLKIIPLNSLFLETDNADLSICHVYASISSVLGVKVDKLSNIIAQNVKNTFI